MLPQGLVWETPAITKAIERADMLVLEAAGLENETRNAAIFEKLGRTTGLPDIAERVPSARRPALAALMEKNSFRSEEHTSELQPLMSISYAVFCLKKQKTKKN